MSTPTVARVVPLERVALVHRGQDGQEYDHVDGRAVAALLLGTGPGDRSTLFDAEQIAQRTRGLAETVRAVAIVNEENASRTYSAALYVVAALPDHRDDVESLLYALGENVGTKTHGQRSKLDRGPIARTRIHPDDADGDTSPDGVLDLTAELLHDREAVPCQKIEGRRARRRGHTFRGECRGSTSGAARRARRLFAH